ncbi:hypothetical protein QJS04_geneDACA014691 [Acorus gramineus]|uniref:Protein transport protein SEC23 n=1 Tax=Acorus gramineus TaxID=55184 RepID=A0AAV9B493_ACOGR|nr:hypothetical protein QJS04_geneDACA014691 [Acorus gramineus]
MVISAKSSSEKDMSHGSSIFDLLARFLLAKLNPSFSYNSANDLAPGSDIIFTDDVNLQVFIEHLQRLVV